MRSPLPEGCPGGCAVWRLDLDLAAPVPPAGWALPDDGENTHAGRLRRHEERVHATTTRASPRPLLAAHFDTPPRRSHPTPAHTASRHGGRATTCSISTSRTPAREQEVADAIDFHDRGVVKEAAPKALGLGVGDHLRSLSASTVADSPDHAARLALRYRQARPALHACRLPARAGHVAALAWSSEDSPR